MCSYWRKLLLQATSYIRIIDAHSKDSLGGSVQTLARAEPTTHPSRRAGEASLERVLLQPAVELQSAQWSQK